jgi:hypothetical protein
MHELTWIERLMVALFLVGGLCGLFAVGVLVADGLDRWFERLPRRPKP